MDVSITREEGHAHVAAVRVLKYRLGRPPTMAEVIEAARTPEEMWLLLVVAFPKSTLAEVRQLIADRIQSLDG
ncbi:MAG: hypothetical protein IH800_16665, partial [Myxococcales bacterium]|nr:hypothetical protein [Myxococcales bacterium]